MTTDNKRNYGAFYALLRNHPMADKDELVLTYTGGRTSHLHEMKQWEYREMVDALSRTDASAQLVQLKKARSSALLWIGRLGIETVDNWDGINAFCESPKIAGKPFRDLSVTELQGLVKKLRAIHEKGGIRGQEPSAPASGPEQAPTVRIAVPIAINKIKS